MQTLIETTFATYKFNPNVPCVEMHWNGFVNSTNFRSILEEALVMFKDLSNQHEQLGWLADTTKLRVIGKEDRQWIEETYNPQLFSAGLKYMAIIMPDNTFGQMSIKDIISSNKEYEGKEVSYHMRLFDNYPEAESWLQNKLQD